VSAANELVQSQAAKLQEQLAAAGLDWIVPDWPAPANVGAFTTTRSGATESITAFVPSPAIGLRQVHGADVAFIDAQSLLSMRNAPPIADAAVTRLPNVVCAVATADCLPVLFADRRGQAVGAAHAGWRGLAAGVLERTVESLARLGSNAGDLVVWLGPAIGPRVFEVGVDVYDAFCAEDPDAIASFVPYRSGKWLADIYALARQRLARCDVHSVTGGGWCTFSESMRFYSYRRERSAGRMLSVIWRAET
jgi:YfiH family protein